LEKKMKHMTKITMMLVASIAAFGIVSDANASLGDLERTGYTAMGGSVMGNPLGYITTAAGGRNYVLLQPIDGGVHGPAMWGYAWMKFTNLPMTTVQSAHLVLNQVPGSGMGYTQPTAVNPIQFDIYAVTADVSDITINTAVMADFRNNHVNTAPAITASINSPGVFSVDITSIVNGWITGNNYGMVLSGAGKFSSFGNPDGAAPYLSTTAIPEPATMILLGIGAGLLGRMRRTR
jgi:hypothetical protein